MLAKIPVLVGVEIHEGSSSNDKVTDHYVTLVGMGSDARGKYFFITIMRHLGLVTAPPIKTVFIAIVKIFR